MLNSEILHLQCESKENNPPKTFYNIFTHGEPVKLKFFLVVAQPCYYVYNDFDPVN